MYANGARARNSPEVLVIATAGRDMYRRRGGRRYALGEIALQRILIRCGLKSLPSAALDGFVRAAVFVLPARIRAFIYENFLRV
jgi:hypothetical protein